MEELKIDLNGCSSDAIVKSTLATLHVFHEEIISMRRKLYESERMIESLKHENDERLATISSVEDENSKLKIQVSELQKQLEQLKKEYEKDSQTLKAQYQDSLDKLLANHEKALETEKLNSETELTQAKSELMGQLEDLDSKLKEQERISSGLTSECEQLSQGLLSIFGRFAKGLSVKINSLLSLIESKPLKDWIGGILDKGDGSELKGLRAFNEIKSIDLLKRNIAFQNSLFSEIATLLMWSSNEELKDKIAHSFEWGSLSNLFNEFLNLLSVIGISVSVPKDMDDGEWLSQASNIADQTEQKRFLELFGKDLSIEKGAPLFITSVSVGDNRGSYIRFYK